MLYQVLNNVELVVKNYLNSVKAKVLHMKRVSALQDEFPIIVFLLRIASFPFIVLYYIYIMPPLFVLRKFLLGFSLTLKIICLKSSHARHMAEHISALLILGEKVLAKILASKLTELISFCITTSFEIIYAFLWPFASAHPEEELTLYELSELLSYEEAEGYSNEVPDKYRRSIRAMHNYVPSKPFKATIRIHRSPMPMSIGRKPSLGAGTNLVPASVIASSTAAAMPYSSAASRYSSATNNSYNNMDNNIHNNYCISSSLAATGTEYLDADSPASFPPTPFSRARVMNLSSERVVSVMFAARDRLRLEAQSVSRDEYSRTVAREAQTSGQFAIFDPRQTSNGIALTCGNHCAIKVGVGLCCCCRSMVPIPTNTYVYFEFSITVSNAQIPTLGIGLSPPDCPPNVMVGTWPRSVGLYTDGQILIDSHWYQSSSGRKIEAGSTVGMLVYLPTKDTATASANDWQQQQQQQEHPHNRSRTISSNNNDSVYSSRNSNNNNTSNSSNNNPTYSYNISNASDSSHPQLSQQQQQMLQLASRSTSSLQGEECIVSRSSSRNSEKLIGRNLYDGDGNNNISRIDNNIGMSSSSSSLLLSDDCDSNNGLQQLEQQQLQSQRASVNERIISVPVPAKIKRSVSIRKDEVDDDVRGQQQQQQQQQSSAQSYHTYDHRSSSISIFNSNKNTTSTSDEGEYNEEEEEVEHRGGDGSFGLYNNNNSNSTGDEEEASVCMVTVESEQSLNSSMNNSVGGGNAIVNHYQVGQRQQPGCYDDHQRGGAAVFRYTINGEAMLHPVADTARESVSMREEIVSMNAPLYPTVSLFTEDTRVWCRFCEADVVYRSRAAVGAPPGVRVYCLDGTLLLEEHDQ